MKKSIFLLSTLILFLQSKSQTDLKGVTFGVGFGWSHVFKTPKDFYLTTDDTYKLQQQAIGRSNITISSVISVKLSRLALQQQEDGNGIITKEVLVTKNRVEVVNALTPLTTMRASDPTEISYKKANFFERLTLNASLNLAEINSDNIAFNKSIDGGIGLGVYFNEFTQLAVFFDIISIRQLRDYVVDTYLDNSIPNGSDIYNALDDGNNSLFYNKKFAGFSFKIIFSIGNK